MNRKFLKVASSTLVTLFLGFAMSGCGGGDGGTTVSGVAATGAPMSGTVFMKDAANNPEMSTTINAQNGAFSFDVSGKTAPFMLRAGSLYSMSGGPGRANINPFSNLMVADMGGFRNMSSVNTFYTNPNGSGLRAMFGNMSTARLHLRQTMGPLMSAYGVPNADPVTDQFTIGQGMDRMFDDVRMTIDSNGNVTMMYVNGTSVFIGPMGNMAGGTMMPGNIMMNTVVSGISVTPSAARLQVNGTQHFAANTPVMWSVASQNGGSITSAGLYTAPALQGMYLIKAISIADPTKTTTATVMVGRKGMMM